MRLWSPMGDEEATIGEDKNVKDRRVNRGALNEAAQTNHGNLNAGGYRRSCDGSAFCPETRYLLKREKETCRKFIEAGWSSR